MQTHNRLFQQQPDYILVIIRKPADWTPSHFDDRPPTGRKAEILEADFVASYEEAHEDAIRCNQYAMRLGLDRWAMVISPSADI
jgi:hypothetical protein